MTLQVGVKVFLRNLDGKVLLLKRAEEKYGKTSGSWDIVGGRIDPGTSLLENLKREISEETKLLLTSEPKLIAAQDIIPNDERHVVRLTYIATTSGEPQLDLAENTEYQWFTFKEIVEGTDIDAYTLALIKDGVLTKDSWS